MPRMNRALLLVAAAMIAVGVFASACGDDDDDGDNGDTTPAATAPASGETAEATPGTGGGEEIDISGIEELSDGTLVIGSDIAYAPIEFFDENNNPVGLDVDLANAMGEALGVEVEFQNAGFTTLLPSLEAERYDIIMSSMTINPERTALVDMIPYFNAGFGIVVPAGNPQAILATEDLCGKTVAVQGGTIQVEFLIGTPDEPGGVDKACTDAGSEGVTVREFESDPEAVQALIAGQADAEMADFPVAAYSASQNEGQLEVVEPQVDPAPYGIALRKDSDGLEQALEDALEQIIDDGTYDEILEKWNLTAGGL